jgi:hypothetical protein
MRRIPPLCSVLAIVSACSSPSSPAGGSSESGSTSLPDPSSATSVTTASTTTPVTTTTPADSSDTTPATTSSSSDDGVTTDAVDMGLRPADPCDDGTAFCESFDDYVETALADGQTFGPWRAGLDSPGATMDLDGTHTVSGDSALHVLLDQGTTSGGRLTTNGDVPLLADSPTHVYGRMMMFIEQNGTSIHWTFFGVQGPAEPSAPVSGTGASYIMSSLPRDGVNTYSFVDGLDLDDYYQDCSTQGEEPMPTGEWTCVSFEMDSVARHLRMWVGDDAEPIVSVDEHGNGCVQPAPSDSVWYGPAIESLFVGTWSFHEMNAPLEVWIDDLIVDSVPVACP